MANIRQSKKFNNGKGGQNNFNSKTPDSVRYKGYPSKVVDGMTVYGANYPKFRFGKMNNNQRQAVIEMRRQHRASNGNNNNVVAAAMTAVQEDMSVLEDRIVAAVQRGSGESNDDLSQGSSNTDSSKRKAAPSGSIGSFLASQSKRNKSS